MQNLFSLYDLLLLIGMSQGIITSVLLLRSKKNQPSNKFLALALLTFCLISVKTLLNTLDIYRFSIMGYFPLGIEYALAPLLYFYVVSLITPNFRFGKKDLAHFVPFFIFQSYAFLVYFSVVGLESNVEKNNYVSQLFYQPIKQWEDYLIVVSIFGYLIIAFFKLKKYQQQLRETTSDNTFPTFSWLTKILILSSVLGIIMFVNLSLDIFFDLKQTHYFHWQALNLYIAFIIYYLGFVGYQQPNFQINGREKTTKDKTAKQLNEEQKSQIVLLINGALEKKKVFLNPTLSAKELAKSLSISQANLSHVINHSFKKSFKDLINHYRIKDVKKKLVDDSYSHLSILAIALECGFNSEASFYRIFKKQVGCSPKEYISKIKQHS